MEQKHKQILQNSLEYIVRNLHNVERICEYLEVDDILIEEDLSQIKQKSEKTRALLSILPYRGNTAYASFIDALKRTENICVADYLGQELHEDIHYTEKSSFKLKKERIYDIQTNSTGLLIIADGKQDKILTCTLSGGNQKKIKLPGKPDGFAIIDNENIAVTLPYEKDIVFVDISKGEIVKKIRMGLCCTAIAYFNSKFIVCVDNTIKILDIDGKIQSTGPFLGFTTDEFSVGKNGNIYCTDYNKLICMDMHANILFKFTGVNTRRPRGVTTDDEGYILVAYDHSHNVHRVSPDGSRSKEIVRKLPKIDWSPFICFDSVTKSIIIGRKDKVIVYTRSA